MHDIQKILLKRLLVQNGQRYSALTSGYNFEDNIVFHLKQLISNSFIKKEGNTYSLTADGVKTIAKFDRVTLEETGFKTFVVGFLCGLNGSYLVKERLAEHGSFYNLPSGKPRFGEPIEEALVRTFEENTKLTLDPADFKYLSLHLQAVKTTRGEVLFDDAFAIYRVSVTSAQKEGMRLQKRISWKTVEEIRALKNRWPEIDICVLKKDVAPYLDYEVISNYTLD